MDTKNIYKHLPHYVSLIGILIAGLVAIIWFSYDPVFQMGVAIAVAVGYVVWGIVHHYIHRDLYLSVVLEYVAVGILGVVIVASLLFRALSMPGLVLNICLPAT